ncbi:MAG: hypothetical protein ACHQ9S_17010 [Candidatus Binatia bacterium]
MGSVTGLGPGEHVSFKVIVYVRTDRWRIHPFDRGGPGRSFAQIDEDGRWRIGTIGSINSSNVVALLVDGTCNPPTEVDDIDSVPAISSGRPQFAVGTNQP